MKKYLCLFLLVGCGSIGGGSSNKGITSLWTRSDDSFVFDLSANTLPISAASMEFVFNAGARCCCTLDITGTETSGVYILSSCTYTTGGAGDPGCASINSNGTYSANGANMDMCVTGHPCVSYK